MEQTLNFLFFLPSGLSLMKVSKYHPEDSQE